MLYKKHRRLQNDTAHYFYYKSILKKYMKYWKLYKNNKKQEKEERKILVMNNLKVIFKEWYRISKIKKLYKLQINDIKEKFNLEYIRMLFNRWKDKIQYIQEKRAKRVKMMVLYENNIPLKSKVFSYWHNMTKSHNFDKFNKKRNFIRLWKEKINNRKEHDKEIYEKEGGEILYYFRKWMVY